jgi:hypothetical protein
MYPYDRSILRLAEISMMDYTKVAPRGAYGSSGMLTREEVPGCLRIDELQFTVG